MNDLFNLVAKTIYSDKSTNLIDNNTNKINENILSINESKMN